MKRALAALAAAAGLVLSVGAVAAADLVVLESNVPALAPGSVVPSSQQVALDRDARLTVIAADGTTRSVAGPYSGPLGRAGADAPGVLDRLTSDRGDSNHVVGAIRAPSWDQ